MKLFLISLFIFFISDVSFAQGYITTVAGNGVADFAGDSNLAVLAKLKNPGGVAVDTKGNIYIADRSNHRIRKVDSNGVITTIAGNGQSELNGDSIPAINAVVDFPFAVTTDKHGNIYFTEYYYGLVRKIDSNGILKTVAGLINSENNGDGGPATLARLGSPTDVALDSNGNIYISDAYFNCVRKVDANGIISTIAGTGDFGYNGDNRTAITALLNGPGGVAIDMEGNVLIADTRNHRIRKINSSGIITTIAGYGIYGYSGDGGPATEAQLHDPADVHVGRNGVIYIADLSNHSIRKIDLANMMSTLSGVGIASYSGDGEPAIYGRLNSPVSVTTDSAGNVFIADMGNHRIRETGNVSFTVIDSLIPSFGTAGNVITIKGKKFTGARGLSFQGISAAAWGVINDSTITATLGNVGASGTVYVYGPVVQALKPGFTYVKTCNWNGSPFSTVWENSFNWSCNYLPGASNHVVINSGSVVINSNVTIWSLTVAPGATLTVNAPYTLTVLH